MLIAATVPVVGIGQEGNDHQRSTNSQRALI